jgi:hypothetical protein
MLRWRGSMADPSWPFLCRGLAQGPNSSVSTQCRWLRMQPWASPV